MQPREFGEISTRESEKERGDV